MENNTNRNKRRRMDAAAADAADNEDWPTHDTHGKYPYIPYNQRTVYHKGFDAGIGTENDDGIIPRNLLGSYPPAAHMRLTNIGDRNSLYSTGDIELDRNSGIASHIIRGDTDKMRTPIMTGDTFDSMRDSANDVIPYTPLSMQERQQLLDKVTGGTRRRTRRATTKSKRSKRSKRTKKSKKSKKSKRSKRSKKNTYKRHM